MLTLAAREAEMINVNFDLREGRVGRAVAHTGLAEATDQKLAWIKEAAGERFGQIELGVWILLANVTDERDAMASTLAPSMGFEPADVLAMPHFLIGSVEQIIENLVARRERFGISHVVVPGETAESLAPVVERLSGN